MEIRICPKCNKAFYTPKDADCLFCLHCGYVLLDRRVKERKKTRFDFTFSLKGMKITAKLNDYSESGAQIAYKGEALQAGVVVDVDIDELNIHRAAEAVWSRKNSRSKSLSGLRLL